MKRERKAIHLIDKGILLLAMVIMVTPRTFGIPKNWWPWTTLITIALVVLICSGVFES